MPGTGGGGTFVRFWVYLPNAVNVALGHGLFFISQWNLLHETEDNLTSLDREAHIAALRPRETLPASAAWSLLRGVFRHPVWRRSRW
jgi:hypothetical protein